MQTRKTALVVLMAVILITLPLFGGQAGAAEKKLKIGFCGPLSGGAASWGMCQLNSVRHYADKSNKAGGMKLGDDRVFFEVFGEDSKYVASEAVAGVTKLIHVAGVKYLFLMGAVETMAVNRMANDERVPIFCGAWGDVLGPDYPMTFRYIIDGDASTLAQAAFVKKRYPEIKTVATLNADNDSGHGTAKNAGALWEALGVKRVENAFYEEGAIDFFPVMTKIIKKKPDFIDLGMTVPGNIPLVVEAARDLGYTGQFTSGGIPDQPIKGVITVGIVPGDPKESQAQKEYREAYMAEHGALHSWWEFYANGTYSFFKSFLPDAQSGDAEVVYKTITAPGYKFDTWWGKSYWFGKDIWGADRNLASWVPIKKGTGDKWVQLTYVPTEDYFPLYKIVKKNK